MKGFDSERYEAALLDWLACAVRGSSEPAARAAAAAGDGLLERVTAAGTAGHVLDFDDTYLPGLAHLSAPAAPAALLLGAELGANLADALDAFAAGFEAAGAMSRAAHPALYDGGWHPTAVCGALGAAVASARLLDLGREAERSAAALALLRSAGLRSAFGSAGKSLQVGMAAAAGVAAARIAAGGARLDLEQVAAGMAGFEEAFGAGFAWEGEVRAINENWIKAYPCCLQTHAAVEAALQLREAGTAGGTGDRSQPPPLELTVHPVSVQAAPLSDPVDGMQAKFSLPYLTALALLHGAPQVDSFASVDTATAKLGANVSVSTDPALLESEARLSADGESFRVEAALGSPLRPMDEAALARKRTSLAGDRLETVLDAKDRPVAELLAPLPL